MNRKSKGVFYEGKGIHDCGAKKTARFVERPCFRTQVEARIGSHHIYFVRSSHEASGTGFKET